MGIPDLSLKTGNPLTGSGLRLRSGLNYERDFEQVFYGEPDPFHNPYCLGLYPDYQGYFRGDSGEEV